MENYKRLYSAHSKPEEAFLLEDGNVYFFASEGDKYALKGRNIIIGSTEIIMDRILGIETNRIETAVIGQDSKVKRLPVERFLSSIKSYSFILNVSMVIAKQVYLTNQIINRNLEGLEGEEKKTKEIATKYYEIVSRLKREYDKRRLPWLKELVVKYETSLTFKRGEAFGKATEQSRVTSEISMTDKYIEFPKDSVICEEGTVGEEMYILQSGTVDVYIEGHKVVSIGEPGAVFGEIALLLGEKRTATLKARNNVVLTRIMKRDIKEIAERQPEILIDVVSSLAKKHFQNINKIKSINQLLVEQSIDNELKPQEKKKLDYHRMSNELLSLKSDINKLCDSKGADFLRDLVEGF
jgi:uncharacterized protein (UPF0305 family)